jgi:hypothetical protein
MCNVACKAAVRDSVDRISTGIYQEAVQSNRRELERILPGAAALAEVRRILADVKRQLAEKRAHPESSARAA